MPGAPLRKRPKRANPRDIPKNAHPGGSRPLTAVLRPQNEIARPCRRSTRPPRLFRYQPCSTRRPKPTAPAASAGRSGNLLPSAHAMPPGKLGGYRTQIVKDGDSVRIYSRNSIEAVRGAAPIHEG